MKKAEERIGCKMLEKLEEQKEKSILKKEVMKLFQK